MKLQIQGQSLRFRIDEAELSCLLAGEMLEGRTQITADRYFSQAIGLHAGKQVMLEVLPDRWRVLLPEGRLRDYVARLPCRDALAFAVTVAEGVGLSVQFEVDVRDSLQVRGPRRRGESPQASPLPGATDDS